ncbi:MAG: PAS domain S-box protein [Geothrix sp.]|nr:PAS domain S-box protein [Geothrix sp.]NWJ39990.1 PAS domain S-box protein [Geothrix sp.]WIL22000.1 MAG: PAS domain S-box protein [Geothrix sp.]
MPQESLEILRQRAEGLQARLESTQGMLDAISEAIYIQDAEGRFVDVNEGAARMYGYPRDFFLGKTPEVLSAPGRNDMDAVAGAFGRALQGVPQQFEYWGRKQDGTVFPKEVRLYPGLHLGRPVVIAVAQDISARKRAEMTQKATYRIAEAALESRHTADLFPRVHAIVRDLMPAENLYFALWDPVSEMVSFPYWIDQSDPAPPPHRLGRGLTAWVLRRGLPLLVDQEALLALEAAGEVEPLGTLSLDWLGVPLKGKAGVFGALVIQSYEGGHRYSAEERDLLVFVSTQVALAVERTRAQSEQRVLKAAMDSAIDPVFGSDEWGGFVFVNQAASASLGYSREELLGRHVWDVDPKVLPDQWPLRWERLRSRGSNREETWHQRKDGSVFPVDISSTFLTVEGQEVAFTHVRDMTERRAAEEALRASEDKFSKAFQASPDAININRLDGTYLDANPAFTRMSGWTREEYLGRTTLELGLWADPEDRERMRRLLQAEGRFSDLEAPFRMKDGSLRTGLVSGAFIQVGGETCLLSVTRDITERKEAEAAIRYNEDKFTRAFHASPDAINLTRLSDGTYFEVSEGFEKISGWTREEAIGRTALELNIWVDPKDRERAVELIRNHGEYTGLEIAFRRKDGRIITGQMSGKVMEVGGVPCLLSVTRDITDRKLAESALRAAEQRLRTVLANSEAVIYQLDPEGRFMLSEGLGLAHLGLAPGQMVGMNALDLYQGDLQTVDQIRAALGGEASRQITPVGERLFDNFLTPVFNDQGQVDSVIGIATDVTERQRVEEALRAERGLFVGGPVMVIRWGAAPPWPVDYISPNVEKLLGYAPVELTSGRIMFDDLVHPEDRDRVHRESESLRRKGVSHFEQRYRLRNAAGEYRWFQDFTAQASPETNASYYLGYMLDITDRLQVEEALRQSQKLESLGILAGGIAHDFNNLLTVVLGNLNLAQMNLAETAPAQPYLARMEATVLRATELTKQMLAYSGRGHFLVKPHDLNEVVQEVTHLLEVSIPKKIRLRFDLEPGLPAIQADAAQIQQVVMNLVTNAADAIGDREGAIHLTTSSALLDEQDLHSAYTIDSLPPGRYVLLEVVDTGIGMPPDVLARIFDPFFTTKASGRGLGLSAMLGILRGHGAGLRIQSEVGRGSSFRLCFPASGEAVAATDPAREKTVAPRLHGRVLLVDDEDLILQTIGAALQAIGLEVTMARDGLEALERFRDADPRPDLVLMDLTMPRMDGREAFGAMHDLDPTVPIVLSSGFTEGDSLQTLSGQGPAGFMQKPYQIKELRLLLQRVLGG